MLNHLNSDFGIDYKYQQQCTTKIPELLSADIRQGLQKEIYGDSLVDILRKPILHHWIIK